MAIAYYPSLAQADTLEVTFSKLDGTEITLRLLVDSGFTGQSCFVLDTSAEELAHAAAPASQVTGALQGTQNRIVVSCCIAALAFRISVIAILANTATLALPSDAQGIVGLRFLRYFRRWGAERSDAQAWRFYLETDS